LTVTISVSPLVAVIGGPGYLNKTHPSDPEITAALHSTHVPLAVIRLRSNPSGASRVLMISKVTSFARIAVVKASNDAKVAVDDLMIETTRC
jgi:hypothetical protein